LSRVILPGDLLGYNERLDIREYLGRLHRSEIGSDMNTEPGQ
jgi:hypothetical protein